jgi:hypothetical protein
MAQRIEKQLAHLQLEQQLIDAFASRVNAKLPALDSDPNI